MDVVNKTKSSIKGKITRLESYVETINNETDSIELKIKLKTLGLIQNNIQELREKYYSIPNMKESELISLEDELNQMEDRLETCEVRIETSINSCMKTSSERVINEENNKFEIKTKIPPLVLPEFSGKYEEFSTFKIQFDDLITNNVQLSETQKLYYLRSCLTNDAKDLSSNFDNFDSLYNALVTRYDNERLIINIHIQNILNFEKIQSENAKEIRNMIDCIQKNLRALKVLKYDQNNLSDILLINILVQKLDRKSKEKFEISHNSKNVPTFLKFIKYLEQCEAVLLSIIRNATSKSTKINTKNIPNL